PAFLGYRPDGVKEAYPFALCASVNNVIVHGQPYNYELKSGDLLKLDLGVDWKGGISDSAITVLIGKVSKEKKELAKITKDALLAGIKASRGGNTIGDIGHAIKEVVVKNHGFVVDGLTGHGVGEKLHEEPSVFNFGTPGEGMKLRPGMVLALEPMVSMGTSRIKQLPDDSFATADGSDSAHFEHTILITEGKPEILTN
ncbi:MAG: type I methionyl aminopeptidase, partial [Patescibacteria group bacterium]